MRVIAGSARGMKLKGPGALPVRPATDRVRESVFGTLGALVEDAQVLDAFAGCGTLGIEALSRGARRCVFVEKNRRVVKLLIHNLEHTRLADRATVLNCDAFRCARRLTAAGAALGLLFFDPPYRLFASRAGWQRMGALMTSIAEQGLALADGLFIVRHRRDTPPVDLPGMLDITDQRTYGETAVTFLGLRERAAPPEPPCRPDLRADEAG